VRTRREASAPSPAYQDDAHSLHGGGRGSFMEVGRIEATDNLRVSRIRPLMPAAVCIEEMEASSTVKHQVFETRCEVSGLLHGESDKLLVIVGPCAVHDRHAAMEYAARLVQLAREVKDELLVVMQVNFESSSAGGEWKGMLNDPNLDGSFKINDGIRTARQLLLDINRLGLPCGCEYLDTITPQFIADLISWAFVGSTTCASRAHRELASGLSTPVGFCKDEIRDAILGSSGERVALDAVRASASPHAFLSVSKQGVAGIVETTGNRDCHVVLPADGLEKELRAECDGLRALELPARVMVSCNAPASAGSVSACQQSQKGAVADVAARVGQGDTTILGVLLNSFLLAGRQERTMATHGMSVTEPCLDWMNTDEAIRSLASAVQRRRAAALGGAKKQRVQ